MNRNCRHSAVAVVFLAAVFLSECTPPPGWNMNSYLNNGGARNRLLAGKNVRVKLFAAPSAVVTAPGSYSFRPEGSGAVTGSGNLTIDRPGEYGTAKGMFKVTGKVYAGRLQVIREQGTLFFVNHVPMDEYLMSVVGHEMNPDWEKEALKAQAVVARTYLVARMQTSSRSPYDVDDTTANQVYGGKFRKEGNLPEVISSTSGEVLKFRGNLAQVFYFSSCGGHTASADEVWHTSLPYLTAKSNNWCRQSPVYKWTARFPREQFARLVRVNGVRGVSIDKRTPSGRVESLVILTSDGTVRLDGNELRKRLGGTVIKSTLFGVRLTGNDVEIAGRGYGHGVGLCQWGSRYMAKDSKRYKDILKFYFPGTEVGSLNASMFTASAEKPAGNKGS